MRTHAARKAIAELEERKVAYETEAIAARARQAWAEAAIYDCQALTVGGIVKSLLYDFEDVENEAAQMVAA